MLEDLDVAGAVHRLDDELALVLGHGGEHVLAEPLPVARGLPHRLVEDLRCVHLVVAGRVLPPAHVVDEVLEQLPALGVPEHDARPLLLEVEEVHLAPQLAVVALLGLLQLLEVGRQLLLGRPGGAVDALQLRLGMIAAPVGARELGELEGLADLAGGGHVRAAAQIEPLALLVDLEVLALGDRVDQLDLEQLALLAEEVLGLLAAPELLRERRIARDNLAHPILYLCQVVGMKWLRLGEIVEESILDHRADGHLGAGPKALHRLRHHVRGVMPDQLQRLRVGARYDLDARILLDRIGQVGELAVDHHGDGPLRERLGDALGEGLAADAAAHGALGPVGKSHDDVVHGRLTRCIPRR